MGLPTGYETEEWPFMEVPWFRPVVNQQREVRYVVIHTMENQELGMSAENCVNHFRTVPSDKQASAHLCIDNNSIIRCVRDNDVAYAAPGANRYGIQLELAGRAAQKKDEWSDDYSKAVLENAANATAQYCLKYALPPIHLTNDELAEGKEGIIGHKQATDVYKEGTHWDPGPDFPWDYFINRVKEYIKLKTGSPSDEDESRRLFRPKAM
jgi:N-acetyl-anhydromuramyl-L-alanine amidase AmpD